MLLNLLSVGSLSRALRVRVADIAVDVIKQLGIVKNVLALRLVDVGRESGQEFVWPIQVLRQLLGGLVDRAGADVNEAWDKHRNAGKKVGNGRVTLIGLLPVSPALIARHDVAGIFGQLAQWLGAL